MHDELTHPYELLDVFTDTPLEGNALAVFTEGESVPSRLMQAAARELHLSETVFLLPGDDSYDAQVRIFTPEAELPFAGHPVLGSAFVVAEQRGLATVRLLTGLGVVTVVLTREDSEVVYGEMVQPLPKVTVVADPSPLLEALRISSPALPVEMYINGPSHVMVGLESPEQVAALTANPLGLSLAAERLGIEHLAVSCFAKVDEARFKTRVFCPETSIPEDPATGSAAGPLGLHCARHGWTEFGATIELIQGIELERPSRLVVRVDGASEHVERIVVGGNAVRVAHGHFRLQ